MNLCARLLLDGGGAAKPEEVSPAAMKASLMRLISDVAGLTLPSLRAALPSREGGVLT